MKPINAKDVTVIYNGKVLGCTKGAKFTVNQQLDEATCTDSDGWVELSAGQKSWNGSLDGVYREFTAAELADNVAMGDIFDALDNGAIVTLSFGKKGTTNRYVGDAYIATFDYTHPETGVVTWSASFTGTGKIARV